MQLKASEEPPVVGRRCTCSVRLGRQRVTIGPTTLQWTGRASCDRGQPRGPRYGSGWLRKHTTEVRAGLRMPEGRLEVGPLLPLLGSDRMALVRTHAARASAQAKERFQRLRGPRGLVALRLRSRVELDGP